MNRASVPWPVWLAVAMAATVAAGDGIVDPAGRVTLSVDPSSVVEGGTATWTVTATTQRNVRPESGHVLRVRVVSADDWAEASRDYQAVDRTVSLGRSDFARDKRSATRRAVFAGRYRRVVAGFGRRWIARRSGAVKIVDDAEVEETETFMLTVSITGGIGWATGTKEGVEVAIPDTDAWGVEVLASQAEIVEGETAEMVLTARILQGDGRTPPERTCVVPIPVRVRLETGGGASRGGDYTLSGLPENGRIPACAPEVSWTVRLAAHVDSEDDADETVIFTPLVDGYLGYGRTAHPVVVPALVTLRERR